MDVKRYKVGVLQIFMQVSAKSWRFNRNLVLAAMIKVRRLLATTTAAADHNLEIQFLKF